MRLPYSEGSAFLVPLRGGGYARGVVARAAPKGKVLLGYFFGPKLPSERDATFEGLQPEAAVLRVRFGDLGLVKGHWPILGSVPNWNRAAWQMPSFVRRDPLGKLKPRLVQYSDDDPNREIGEQVIDDDAGLQRDALSGYAAVSIKLDNLLR
jgi:hypothetical protein